ncbi:ABC transporter ATP-binding protein [Paenibacillus sp. P96]|uniref:ABC transporter ATP-binding protein n=1 Tax=Paenibacillus zeirhizosphaerae TaxID=2987519 RepID=A0ABT9FMN6_9BACL|nr:ABC transporter ATP-binding protein [Paenibacillus sp. P96]MDP4095870.1 ABC transporter ATP-binding protein [Paenibacillus sp. P96]
MLLQMEHITKRYGEVTANRDVNFDLRAGEVHALVGENGAGKTTLMRMLYGMEQPTSGTIRVRGQEVSFTDPSRAIASGIGMVHQHFMLFPSFTVAENIVIGREPSSAGGRFNRKAAAASVEELGRRYGMPVDPSARVSDCPMGMQQRVEILKVLYQGADMIILDEPTGALTPLEVKELLTNIQALAGQGKSFILITHKLHEVMEAADRVTVLRDGQVTGTVAVADTDVEQLSRMMVGRELVQLRKQPSIPGEPILQVEKLVVRGTRDKLLLNRIDLQVRAGEIVGVAGISGNGQSELIQAVAGLRKADEGTVRLAGTDIAGMPVRRIRERGLAHIPEDRYLWGAAKDATVLDNGIMGYQHKLKRGGMVNSKSARVMVSEWITRFGIKAGSLDNQVQNLSGGNLQKLIAAREFAQDAPFLIVAEPTRGVDIGAMETIHTELIRKRDAGTAILLVSSELTEILQLSDRIVVMYEGAIAGELAAADATEEKISLLMAGGSLQA